MYGRKVWAFRPGMLLGPVWEIDEFTHDGWETPANLIKPGIREALLEAQRKYTQ